MPNQEQLERWRNLEKRIKDAGEPMYFWLVGKAPEPIKGLPQKYVVRKMNKATLAMYESKHSYTLGEAKDIAENSRDFEMTKANKLNPTSCCFEHCALTGRGAGSYLRGMLWYICESTGKNII